MTEDIIEVVGEPQRSYEYLQLLNQLKDSFKAPIEIARSLFEQGKKEGLSDELIRKDIESALAGVIKERRLREILPLELKRKYTISDTNSDFDSAFSAESNECKDERIAELIASEQEAINLTETMEAVMESLNTDQRLYDDLEKRLRSRRENGKLIYKDHIELARFAWNQMEKQEAEIKLLKVLEKRVKQGYQHFQDLIRKAERGKH